MDRRLGGGTGKRHAGLPDGRPFIGSLKLRSARNPSQRTATGARGLGTREQHGRPAKPSRGPKPTARRKVSGAEGQPGNLSGTPPSIPASTPHRSAPTTTIVALGSSARMPFASRTNGLPGRTTKTANNAALMAPVCPCRPSCAASLTVWAGRDTGVGNRSWIHGTLMIDWLGQSIAQRSRFETGSGALMSHRPRQLTAWVPDRQRTSPGRSHSGNRPSPRYRVLPIQRTSPITPALCHRTGAS